MGGSDLAWLFVERLRLPGSQVFVFAGGYSVFWGGYCFDLKRISRFLLQNAVWAELEFWGKFILMKFSTETLILVEIETATFILTPCFSVPLFLASKTY